MKNVFMDHARFMQACEQTTGVENQKQFKMYCELIQEEVKELTEACTNNDKVEILDALIDIITVTIGAGHSLGLDMYNAWDEVHNSNMKKIDKETGMVLRREDGKILKPEGWTKPQLGKFIKK